MNRNQKMIKSPSCLVENSSAMFLGKLSHLTCNNSAKINAITKKNGNKSRNKRVAYN